MSSAARRLPAARNRGRPCGEERVRTAVPCSWVLALALLLPACGAEEKSSGDGSADLPVVTPELVAYGQEVFLGDGGCHICHGPDGRGARGVGADLGDGEWWHSDGSYPELVRRIDQGVPSSQARNAFKAAMPPRGGSGIGDSELQAVAAYVWSLRNLPDSVTGETEGPRP